MANSVFVDLASSVSTLTVDTLHNTEGDIQQPTSGPYGAGSVLNSTPDLITQLVGGTDRTISNNYEGFRFNSGALGVVGYVLLRLKTTGTVNQGSSITALVYTDSGGKPNTNISPAGTGTPANYYVSALNGVTYTVANFELSLSLTANTNYWLVITKTSVTGGGNFVWDTSAAAATGLYATNNIDPVSAPPSGTTNWTLVNNIQPYFSWYGDTYISLYGYSANYTGVEGQSLTSWGVRGDSDSGIGVYGKSRHDIGVGGASVNNYGVRGSSVYGVGGNLVSTNNAGAVIQTSGASQVGVQVVSTTGTAVQIVPTTGQFLQVLPQDTLAGGSAWTEGQASEIITLSGGTTTDSTGSLLPAGSFVTAVQWRITTAITGGSATAFQIGTAADATNFENTNATLTLGTSGFGINHLLTGGHAFGFAAATKVRITLNGTSTGGAIRVVVYYRALTAPTA